MNRRVVAPTVLAALLACAAFLGASSLRSGLGFPLDDAWIHQTYARNLARGGEWAFVPGQPSAGSTSPLWTLLLAVGYGLGLEFRSWTYGLGFTLLILDALLGAALSRRLFPGSPLAWALTMPALALEWHLVWAGLSGMETLLFIALTLLVLHRLQSPVSNSRRASPILTGLLIGLSVAVRPDGLALLPVAALALISNPGLTERSGSPSASLRDVLAGAGRLALGFALAVGPYLVLNAVVGGAFWPNTFYAKQAEYASHLTIPFTARLLPLLQPTLVGGQALLLPGIAVSAIGWTHARDWRRLTPLLWALGLVVLYALRLPAAYQHGRYVMPAVPILIVVGVGGMASLTPRLSTSKAGWVASRAWVASAAVLWVAFLVLGGRAYADDVEFVETQMVVPAKWMNENTPPEALIAAHDIGALGYFGSRRLIDLAGLVSPEVIPFIRDEARLAGWLDERGADYLLAFPDWYPRLVGGGQAIPVKEFTSGSLLSPLGPMTVYEWHAGSAGGTGCEGLRPVREVPAGSAQGQEGVGRGG